MNYVTQHWSFDPFIIGAIFTVIMHELGLYRLSRHSRPSRNRHRRRKSLYFYAGLVVLLLAVISPIDYWASDYFFVHMIQHIVLSMAVPILVVTGAPWIPLMFGLPVNTRRKVGRYFYLSTTARPLRAVGRFIRNPWLALVSFNAAMLVWHVPSLFQDAETNQAIHIWLMHGSFLVTGVLFWLQIIPSHPLRPARGPVWQACSVLITNVIMTVMAVSMSILTTVSWYPSYSHIPGVTMSPFADQQIGAAILWVCGDFWALPALYFIIRQSIESEGSLTSTIDRLMGRSAGPSIEDFRPSLIDVVTASEEQ